MELLKKFAKEISVFGIVLVIFIGLFAYRQITFKNYKTISQSELTSMIDKKEDFTVVVGDSDDSNMQGFTRIMQTFTTKNRSIPLYYVDTKGTDEFDSYLKEKLDVNVSYPATLVVKEGKLKAKKEGTVSYYSLNDFIQENLNK